MIPEQIQTVDQDGTVNYTITGTTSIAQLTADRDLAQTLSDMSEQAVEGAQVRLDQITKQSNQDVADATAVVTARQADLATNQANLAAKQALLDTAVSKQTS